jgi:hypothetical protein
MRPAIVLLAVGIGCACRAPRSPAIAPLIALSTAAIETREVQLEDDLVTVRLHIPPGTAPRRPTVIWTLGDRAPLLRQGYLAVTYRMNRAVLKPSPPVPPGEGAGKWVLAAPSASTVGRDYLRTIARTADEVIPRIIDYLVTVPEVDPRRIGIVANSSTGFVALEAAARDQRLAVVVATATCGDYHVFLRYSNMGMEGRPLTLAPAYDRWVRAHEIIGRPAALVHAAVLMLNLDGDPVIPIQCAETTARALRAAYDAAGVPERFRYVVFSGQEHGQDIRFRSEILAWLDRWLDGRRDALEAPPA